MSETAFTRWVPAHFGPGTKDQLLASAQSFEDLRAEAQTALARGFSLDGTALAEAWEHMYDALVPKYGTWVGFREQIGAFVMRGFFGEFMGY